MSEKTEEMEAELIRILSGVFGPGLASVVAYGSFVTGTYVRKSSDINVLILVMDSNPSLIVRLGKNAYRFFNRNRITPLIMSVTEFSRSSDVFPMEYMDIIANHRVLYGDDPTTHVTFSNRYLRHEIEHQLRGVVISLRQLVLAAHGRRPMLTSELIQATGSVTAVFRALLRLTGETEIPTDHAEVIDRVATGFGFSGDPFHRLVKMRAGEKHDAAAVATELLEAFAELVPIVDKYEADQ